ncbi:hypothetical protein B0H13DRAFT_151966 [Mycena leptocephala]|nr:hypothetical protein B0H13DRAFT_151966 [Mycena leptocephala]
MRQRGVGPQTTSLSPDLTYTTVLHAAGRSSVGTTSASSLLFDGAGSATDTSVGQDATLVRRVDICPTLRRCVSAVPVEPMSRDAGRRPTRTAAFAQRRGGSLTWSPARAMRPASFGRKKRRGRQCASPPFSLLFFFSLSDVLVAASCAHSRSCTGVDDAGGWWDALRRCAAASRGLPVRCNAADASRAARTVYPHLRDSPEFVRNPGGCGRFLPLGSPADLQVQLVPRTTTTVSSPFSALSWRITLLVFVPSLGSSFRIMYIVSRARRAGEDASFHHLSGTVLGSRVYGRCNSSSRVCPDRAWEADDGGRSGGSGQ